MRDRLVLNGARLYALHQPQRDRRSNGRSLITASPGEMELLRLVSDTAALLETATPGTERAWRFSRKGV
jgi:hypothetical protein